jgi:Holliday junction resolvase
MANTRYRKGADLERRIRARLEEDGYYVVRSAGSKGVLDLVAFRSGETLFIQVKSGKGKMTRAERMKLVDMAADCGPHAVAVLYEGIVPTVLSRAA